MVENNQHYYNDLLCQSLKNLVAQGDYSIYLFKKIKINDNAKLKQEYIKAFNQMADLVRNTIKTMER